MSDPIRAAEGEAWIPRPRRITPTARRRRGDAEEAFDEELDRGTLTPRRRVREDDARTGPPRRDLREEGLGDDLDLLA